MKKIFIREGREGARRQACRVDERSVIRRMRAPHSADNGLRPHPPYFNGICFSSRFFVSFADKKGF
jgi:hypothetical protein